MTEQRIRDLESQLVAANLNIATLTATNLELSRGLSDAQVRNKKLKHAARKDEKAFKLELGIAQSRRG